jgi:raffinose/stachyose/melibiose transport system permease protein
MTKKETGFGSLWWQYLIALFFLFLFGYPFLWMVYSSFKPTTEIIRSVWALPTNPTLQAYSEVLGKSAFTTYFANSVIISLISVPLLTLISAMIAFAFARVDFPGRRVLFYLFLAGIMIPIHVTIIPLYTMMRDFGLINNLIALLLPYIGFNLPISVYILRGFFAQIPLELEEAARIDGCSTVRIFWSVMLPLARPALATVAVLAAVTIWNEYTFALAFLSGNNQAYTVPLGILGLVRSLGTLRYDQMFAGLTLAALPLMVFYFLAQKQIIKSITAGAVKG